MKNIELLKKLCTAVGVSGEEDAVRALILKEIGPLADRVEVTPLGNIVAFKQGEKRPVKKLMLCAHMDEVGLIVTNITEDGFLRLMQLFLQKDRPESNWVMLRQLHYDDDLLWEMQPQKLRVAQNGGCPEWSESVTSFLLRVEIFAGSEK